MFPVAVPTITLALSLAGVAAAAADPCAAIGGQTWVLPKDLQACFEAQPVNVTEKNNILDVVSKTLAFHTSTNYQILAPLPFTLDVHEDAIADLEKIRRTTQASDYELHIAVSRTIKRLNDGHVGYINYCYDSLFANYVPTPLAVLYDKKGNQGIYIAPEAFTVATAEFGADAVQFWQDALPGDLKGKLSSLSGAQVLAINGKDPWDAVNANTLISGSYQALPTRQNLFFTTYAISSTGWTYSFGQFAAQSLPLSDSVTFKLRLVNETSPRTVTIPYRARFVTGGTKFTDSKSFRAGNCVAEASTNGASYYDAAAAEIQLGTKKKVVSPGALERKQAVDEHVDVQPLTDVVLPPALQPKSPLDTSSGVAQFFLLDDGKTGVLALGSFSGLAYDTFFTTLLNGLQNLKSKGAERLVVDISSNGGGYICVAHWLHRIIAGPKASTVPQAGLDTKARAGPLARQITAKIAAGGDPDLQMLYNSVGWRFDNNTNMPPNYDWLKNPQKEFINFHEDAFSQRLGDECQPFPYDAPAAPLFDIKKVVIVGNSRCASSCALFTITMNKEEGVKTVVVGGNRLLPQQYAGIVGGQSTSFVTIDSEIKTVGLKNSTLAPPDFLTNSYQGLTWRLGYGIWDTKQPEEWQNHPADINLPLTAEIVNNPTEIWKAVAKRVF